MFAWIWPLLLTGLSQTYGQCLTREYDNGTVCVCNSEHCDTIPKPVKIPIRQYYIYTSNEAGLRLEQGVGFFSYINNGKPQIVVNRDVKYQTILGFGGAFTDATGINIASLDEDLQEMLLRSYFGKDGIEYNLCRVPIGGTHFSTRAYSYDDGDVDTELSNFALVEEDTLYKIPLILRASNLSNGTLELFASAWTAPTWMKTNGEYDGYGSIIEEMYQTWADYFVKFLDSYKEEGVEFWGITTGNEPSIPNSQINSVGWNATEMGRWIAENLGPTINSSYPDISFIILDDNRQLLPDFVNTALGDESADQYIDGIGVHWYLDLLVSASVLNATYEQYPTKFILSTEASEAGPVALGSWERGESYSVNIIEDLRSWVSGWVDFNMVLDLTGRPSYINDVLDAPIIVNATAGEFYKQPMYYHLGHFSKFVPRGSIQIDSKTDLVRNVTFVAFQTPESTTAVIILNREEEEVTFNLADMYRGLAPLTISGKSITTIYYW